MADILIVEDDKTSLFVATKLLGKHFNVKGVSTVGEALKAADTQRFDGFILDLNLGSSSMSGIGLMEVLRVKQPHAVICALTAYAEEHSEGRMLDKGFDLYFTKPINATEIVSALEPKVIQSVSQF